MRFVYGVVVLSLCLVLGQERNYIVVLLLMSLAMLSIPIYHEYKLPIW